MGKQAQPGRQGTAGTPRDSLDYKALREIVEGTAVVTGEAFFDELVRHLARAINKKCAWVTEWIPDLNRLRALSFWVGNRYFGDFEYDITGTPCQPVISEKRLIHIPDRVVELFATDPSLKELGAVSYMGVPLLDTDGAILGHLAILDDKPLAEDPRALAVFNIFAGRAGAELRRLRRDRDLYEREEKLRRLIESAMDAIIELNSELSVINLNRAAEKVFRCEALHMQGKSFRCLMTRESYGKLTYLIGQLQHREQGKRSMWIPDGIEGLRSDGDLFPAEATLSRFESGGQTFFTLILRDVFERFEAEAHIRALLSETDLLRTELNELQGFDDIIGESEALRRILADVDRVAAGNTTVLITGETGTGKELIARAIHKRSPRAGKPLVRVNCAAIVPSLQESEFFGHEKGAFTGATQQREGRFKIAHGGTIFLDEIGETPLDLQAKLLRVLQEGEFEPVGSSKTIRIDVRVIAATNRNLEQMVQEGLFRRDLFYRLSVFPVRVPPLRERGNDIVLLAEAYARRFAGERSQAVPLLTADSKARLRRYDWPGNVRELQNVIERAFITSRDGRTLNFDRAFPEGRESFPSSNSSSANEPDQDHGRILTATELSDLERDNLLRALVAAKWKISGSGGAAELLGINANTLTSRMKALRIRRPSSS